MKMVYGFFPLILEPKTFVWLENYPNTPPLPWWERAGVRGSIRLGHFHGLRLPAVGRGPRSFDKLRRRPRLHAQAPQCAGTEGRPYPIECTPLLHKDVVESTACPHQKAVSTLLPPAQAPPQRGFCPGGRASWPGGRITSPVE